MFFFWQAKFCVKSDSKVIMKSSYWCDQRQLFHEDALLSTDHKASHKYLYTYPNACQNLCEIASIMFLCEITPRQFLAAGATELQPRYINPALRSVHAAGVRTSNRLSHAVPWGYGPAAGAVAARWYTEPHQTALVKITLSAAWKSNTWGHLQAKWSRASMASMCTAMATGNVESCVWECSAQSVGQSA